LWQVGAVAVTFVWSLLKLFLWTPRKLGGIVSPILNVGTRWRCVASCISWPLQTWGKSPWCPLNMRLRGAPVPVWPLRRLEKSVTPAGSRIFTCSCSVVRCTNFFSFIVSIIINYIYIYRLRSERIFSY